MEKISPVLVCIAFLLISSHRIDSATLDIKFPDGMLSGNIEGRYRFDYRPPRGYPAPNTTLPPSTLRNGLILHQVDPGTRYSFELYFSNQTYADILQWSSYATSPPLPPESLSSTVSTTSVKLSWKRPVAGGVSSYKLRVVPFSERHEPIQEIIDGGSLQFFLRDLVAGASYRLELYSVYEGVPSSRAEVKNITTVPNSPGRFIVWYRNQTTMLVLWQPPYPPGVFSRYKVSISPEGDQISEMILEKNEGPSQAAFYGLTPGQPYNISIQTISGSLLSAETTAQYRTIPRAPSNLVFSPVGSRSFNVSWDPPGGKTVFDRYVVSFGDNKQSISKYVTSAWFNKAVEPGRTYRVEVKTVSLNVFSWPLSGNVTTKPLPVVNLTSSVDETSGGLRLEWDPAPGSFQDHFDVSYQEQEVSNGDSYNKSVTDSVFYTSDLLPGRNYSLAVLAVSNGRFSEKSVVYHVTKPSTPIIGNLKYDSNGLNISWKSDVTSHQNNYIIIYTRNDTGTTKRRETYQPFVYLTDLYSGASYEVRIYSVSHNIRSDPHTRSHTVPPEPVRSPSVTSISPTSLDVSWSAPRDSLYDGFILRYATEGSQWKTIKLSPTTRWHSLTGLLPGHQYNVKLTAVSGAVESWQSVSLKEVLPPANAKDGDVHVIMGTNSASLFWNSSVGHADNRSVSWWPSGAEQQKKTKVIDGDDSSLEIPIDGLWPGELYVFEMYSTAYGLQSAKVKIENRTRPLFLSRIHYNNDINDPAILTVSFTRTPASRTKFDAYRCHVVDVSTAERHENHASEQQRAANDSSSFVYRDLVPGRLYIITMWTVSKQTTSSPQSHEMRLHPAPVSQMNASKITTTDIQLLWSEPDGDHDGFEIFYGRVGDERLRQLVVQREYMMQSLTPYSNYSVTIRTLAGSRTREMQRSRALTAFFTTDESVPEQVSVFRVLQKAPRQVRLQWTLPTTKQNGVLQSFTVYYGEKDSKELKIRNFSPHVSEGIITDLEPGKTFRFKIQGRTRIGYGASSILEVIMPIWPPPRPNVRVFPTEVSKNATTIHIRFRRNYFSNENGAVTGYVVMVAEDDTADSSSLLLPDWLDVQPYSVWPPYQVNAPYNPFSLNKSVEDFMIGTDGSCSERCALIDRCFCNGPLRPGTSYRVKVRAFTSSSMFADTAYSHRIRTDRSFSGLLAAVLVPLLLLLVLALVIAVMRRRRLGPFRCVGVVKEMRRHKEENVSMRGSIIETSRPVKLKDFIEHYRFMSADSDIRFSEEYEDLKHVGRDQPCSAADQPCNRPKNRFTNILPYDHSRVKLQPTDDEEGSDYINANYVPGFNSPREFIVTQGPLHSTRDDFWRMVWESNSRAIVMLTRCVEKGREKCDRYWPCDTQPQSYGEVHVVTLNQSQLPDWTVSEFRVTRGHVSRVVRHFHFTTWPDFGVPEPPQVLVRFVRAFRSRVPYDQRPIITHCSAGVGRSGTFIALDRVLQHIVRFDYVDIYGMVYELRRERVLMVQTEVQYICIHTSLKVVLEGGENDDLSPPAGVGGGPGGQLHTNVAYEDDEGIVEP